MAQNNVNKQKYIDCDCCKLANEHEQPRVGGGRIPLAGNWALNHNGDTCTFLGWLMLTPLKHRQRLSSMEKCEVKMLGIHIKNIDKFLRKYWKQNFADDPIERIYVVCLAESQEISPHIHFHLIPRTQLMKSMGVEFFAWNIYRIGNVSRAKYFKQGKLGRYAVKVPPEKNPEQIQHNPNVNKLMNYLRKYLPEQTSHNP